MSVWLKYIFWYVNMLNVTVSYGKFSDLIGIFHILLHVWDVITSSNFINGGGIKAEVKNRCSKQITFNSISTEFHFLIRDTSKMKTIDLTWNLTSLYVKLHKSSILFNWQAQRLFFWILLASHTCCHFIDRFSITSSSR